MSGSPKNVCVDPATLKTALQKEAEKMGFDAFGVAPVEVELRHQYYRDWIAAGKQGTMSWMARNLERRLNPPSVQPEARSIVCVGLNYFQPSPGDRRYRIATYAQGKDYHNLMLRRLKKLCAWMREHGGENRPYVDTGPVLERPISERAGIGWQAKNTMVVHTSFGNWLFLGEIFTTLDLEADAPHPGRCGSCQACMDICPTQAITAPYQLDARRCISYLTIEHDGPIPVEFRRAIGDRLFGCDECLEVCPWNRWAQKTREAAFTPLPYPDLRDMLAWTEAEFTEATTGTPLRRLKLPRLKRNACVVLGNVGDNADLPSLRKIADCGDALLAEHARWAIAEIERRIKA